MPLFARDANDAWNRAHWQTYPFRSTRMLPQHPNGERIAQYVLPATIAARIMPLAGEHLQKEKGNIG